MIAPRSFPAPEDVPVAVRSAPPAQNSASGPGLGHDGPYVLDCETLGSGYVSILRAFERVDSIHEKDSGRIKELHPALLTVRRPQARLIPPAYRLCNPGFMAAEAVWILSGSGEGWLRGYNSQLDRYYTSWPVVGAYGPRLRNWRGRWDQLERVVDRLAAEPGSQRATMVIFDPEVDQTWHESVPCTNVMHFMIRDGRLDMLTMMRANDVWIGLPYNFFTFTLLQELIAGFLGVALGSYHHVVDALRLYEADWQQASAASQRGRIPVGSLPAASPRVSWEVFTEMIAALAEYATDPLRRELPDPLPPWWRSLAHTMLSYRAYRAGDHERALEAAREVRDDLRPLLMAWLRRRPPSVPAIG